MSFEVVEHRRGPPHRPDQVAMSIVKKGAKYRSVVITFGENVLQQLGWSGGDRLALLVGRGRDSAKIQFRRDKVGLLLRPHTRGKGRALMVARSPWDGIAVTVCSPTPVNWRARPSVDGIEIDLPDWALPVQEAAE